MIKEKWRDIPNYEGLYQASDLGRIKSLDRIDSLGRKVKGKIIKTTKDKDGYLYFTLCKNGIKKQARVHRVVLLSFVDMPKNKEQVNHINEIKDDNRLCNLEWCDAVYNNNYNDKQKNYRKPVIGINLKSGFICNFSSALEVKKKLNIDRASVVRCCQNKYKQSKGYKWIYEREVI